MGRRRHRVVLKSLSDEGTYGPSPEREEVSPADSGARGLAGRADVPHKVPEARAAHAAHGGARRASVAPVS